jgi:sulfatase modifying factor 1
MSWANHHRISEQHAMRLAVACLFLPWLAGAQLQLSIVPADQPLLSVQGATGVVVQVQWSDRLNASGRWFHLTNYTLGSGNQFTDPNPPPVGARFYRAVTLPKATVHLVPGGSFSMGDTFVEGFTNELPVHSVSISAFYMDRTEITRVDWDSVYVWATGQGYSFDNAGGGKGPTHPVHTVSWYDAVKWCNAKSEMEGKTPAYYTNPAQTNAYRTGRTNLSNYHVRWSANGYRLPTEAEWERAARSGEAGWRFPWGNVITFSNANYQSFSIYSYDQGGANGYHPAYDVGDFPYTSPVGSFPPNAYGLQDMVGNVWEWCWDRFDPAWYLNAPPQLDPKGPLSSTINRVIRGSSWNEDAFYGRCANRTFTLLEAPDSADFTLGFRTVTALPGFMSPAVLDDAAALPNGAFRFTLYNLMPGKTNIVESSTNLTSWSPVATNVPAIAMLNFTNNPVPSSSGRFYRSRQLP